MIMRISAITWVIFTTLYVVIFAVIIQLNISFDVITVVFLAGHILIPVMIYKVLNDDYTTQKTFNDWYEDNPKA